MSEWHGGKGSSPRKVDTQKFNSNWDNIFMKTPVVEIFSTDNCSFCIQAKALSESKGYVTVVRDVGELTPEEWIEKTGFVPRSVPQIFMDNEYVGGAAEFQQKVM